MNNDVIMINLDRPRELRFGHKALKKIVAMTGKTLEEIEMQGFNDFNLVEQLVYCGLMKDAKENNEDLKLEDMEDLLDKAKNYKHITEPVQKAFLAAFGATLDDAEGNDPKPRESQEKESLSIGQKVSE